METNKCMASAFPWLLILFLARSFDVRPVAADPLVADGTVIELNDSNFESAISTFDYILVDFYAPWCGYCKRLSPVLDEAAPVLARLNQPIIIAKLNSDKYRKLASRHEIDRFPTLKLFVHGVPVEYKGPRNTELLIQYLMKYIAPDVSILESASDVHSFIEEAGKHFPIFIGFDLDESLIFEHGKKYKKKSWFAVARKFSEKTKIAYEFDRSPALVAIHPSYDAKDVFYGPFEGSDLDDFVRQNQLPPLVPISYETLNLLNNDERKVVLTIVNDEMNEKSQELFKILRSAATSNRDLIFGYVGVEQWEDFATTFDVDRDMKLPKVIVWNGNDDYQLVEGFESLNSFEDQGSQISWFLEGYREGRTIEKQISVPSFTGIIWFKIVSLIVFAVAFVIFIRKLVKRGAVIRHRRQTRSEAEAGVRFENVSQQQDSQSGFKED